MKASGKHRIESARGDLPLGQNFRVALVDTRKTLLQVAGQEVLSADNVGVKLSVVLTTQIVDAAKSVQAADNHRGGGRE